MRRAEGACAMGTHCSECGAQRVSPRWPFVGADATGPQFPGRPSASRDANTPSAVPAGWAIHIPIAAVGDEWEHGAEEDASA